MIASAGYPLESLHRGIQIGPYTLLESLGLGGEAAVWSGWDERHQRVVALKLMALFSNSRGQKSRVSNTFERQIHLLASLEHPHILPLYGFGETDDYFYFVMRYSCRGSLANLLVDGPLPLEQVIGFCDQITSALAYLHERGIIHRDINPSNVLLDSQNSTYLSDFGLAKQFIQETSPLHTGRGTGPYAPYEQIILSEATPQSDIYSLGILIYELLVGKLPWNGEDNLSYRQKALSQDLPDLRYENPSLPPDLTDVLRKMTAFNWIDRPKSPREAFRMLVMAARLGLPQSSENPEKPSTVDEEALLIEDGKHLLKGYVSSWHPDTQRYPSNLTHLALIDSALSKDYTFQQSLDKTQRQFLLQGAMIYDYRLDHWWRQTSEPEARLQVCLNCIINEESEPALERALTYLIDEVHGKRSRIELQIDVMERMVQLGTSAHSWPLRQDALLALEALAPHRNSWQTVGISIKSDKLLASIAISRGSQAKRASRIIGNIRSETAVQAIVVAQDSDRKRILAALRDIHAVGGLPRIVPGRLRLRIKGLQIRHLIFQSEGAAPVRVMIGLLVGLFVSLLMIGSLFSIQDAQMRDILMQPLPVSNIITLVAVDDASLARFGRWDEWPRSLHAELVDRLHAAGAKVILFDFFFGSTTDQDQLLSKAMERAGNVVLPVLGQGNAYTDRPGTVRFESGLFPQPIFMDSAVAFGHANVLHDLDGYVRRIPITIQVAGDRIPSMALAALRVFLGLDEELPKSENGNEIFAGRQIPVNRFDEMVIHFSGPPSKPNANTFQTVSYLDVMEGRVDPELIKDKIVLVGMAATADTDRYLTPVSKGYPMFGVEILANVIESIWSERFIRQPSQLWNIVILLFLSVMVSLVCTRPWVGLLLSLLIALGYFLMVNWLFDTRNLMLGLFFPFLTIALSYITVTTYKYSAETRQRRKIMQMFERRVTPNTARATARAAQSGALNLDGEVKDVSILLVKLRGYTSIANRYDPEVVMECINRFWDLFNQGTLEYEGTLTQPQSEQAMAFFNAPLSQADHAWRAVETAFAVRARAAELIGALPEHHPCRDLNLSYGVYTGRAIVGNLDSANRKDYTVMGDAVNFASSLADLAKPGQVLMNGKAYERTSHEIVAEPVTPSFVRGLSAHLIYYEAKKAA